MPHHLRATAADAVFLIELFVIEMATRQLLQSRLPRHLLQHIRQAIAESRFTGEGYRKIWARLRFAGIHSAPGRNGLMAAPAVDRRTPAIGGMSGSRVMAPSAVGIFLGPLSALFPILLAIDAAIAPITHTTALIRDTADRPTRRSNSAPAELVRKPGLTGVGK